MKKIFQSFLLVVVALLVAPIARIGASKFDASSFIEGFAEDNGRLLKKSKSKIKKSKAPKPKPVPAPAPKPAPAPAPTCSCVNSLGAINDPSTYTVDTTKTIILCEGIFVSLSTPLPIIAGTLADPNTPCSTYGLKIQCGCGGSTNCGITYTGDTVTAANGVIDLGGFNTAGAGAKLDITLVGVTLSSTSPVGYFFHLPVWGPTTHPACASSGSTTGAVKDFVANAFTLINA